MYQTNSYGNYGWICPKCERVNAPWVVMCQCSEPIEVVWTTWPTSTGEVIYESGTQTSENE